MLVIPTFSSSFISKKNCHDSYHEIQTIEILRQRELVGNKFLKMMGTVVLSPSVTWHSTECNVCTSLQQTVYQTSNPRRQYHAVSIRTLQFTLWPRKVECQSEILQWVNNLLLRYDLVLQDKYSFLTGNGFLLEAEILNELAGLKEIVQQHVNRTQVSLHTVQLYTTVHSSTMALMSCPVRLLSHIHITIPYALHCDSNNWNCCVFKLQKAAAWVRETEIIQ